PFYMYQADRFLEFANQFLGQNVEQAAIDEIKQLREEEEAKELEVEAALQATSAMLAEAVVEKVHTGRGDVLLPTIEGQHTRPVSLGELIEVWKFFSDPENRRAVKDVAKQVFERYRDAVQFLSVLTSFSEEKAASYLGQSPQAIASAAAKDEAQSHNQPLSESAGQDTGQDLASDSRRKSDRGSGSGRKKPRQARKARP
ncbi:MAG TPA: hypothetical protein VFB82_15540, partial [Blastocatellia bacterium]|nr:hypothetical protein [Blastocatellia bacterium]